MLKKIVLLLSVIAFSKVAFAASLDGDAKKPDQEVEKVATKHDAKHKKHDAKNKKQKNHESHEADHSDHDHHEKDDKEAK